MFLYATILSLAFTFVFVACYMRHADRSFARGLIVSIWGISYAIGFYAFTAFGMELSRGFQMPSKTWGFLLGFVGMIGVPGSITAVLLAVAFGRRAAAVTLAATAIAIAAFLLLDVLLAFILAPLIWLSAVSLGMATSIRTAAPFDHLCHACQYDLTGLRVERCPECGASNWPRVPPDQSAVNNV